MLVAALAQQAPHPVHTPAIKPSQHGTVTQKVADTLITVVYNRPVARGRELFGAARALRQGLVSRRGLLHDHRGLHRRHDRRAGAAGGDILGLGQAGRGQVDGDPQPGPADFPHPRTRSVADQDA